MPEQYLEHSLDFNRPSGFSKAPEVTDADVEDLFERINAKGKK